VALSLDNALAAGEGQMVEFKESLKLAKEGMQATVAFANARGGDVFFGVRDRDHVAIGVEVGANTLAQLANDFERRIYPSLPVEIDEFPLGNGKAVVRFSVPQDVPPLIGHTCSATQTSTRRKRSTRHRFKRSAELVGRARRLTSCCSGSRGQRIR